MGRGGRDQLAYHELDAQQAADVHVNIVHEWPPCFVSCISWYAHLLENHAMVPIHTGQTPHPSLALVASLDGTNKPSPSPPFPPDLRLAIFTHFVSLITSINLASRKSHRDLL